MNKVSNWVSSRHWWLLAFVAIFLLAMEGIDLRRLGDDPIHLVEFVIYLLMLGLIGILYDSVFRSMRHRNKMARILEYKHRLSLEFSIYNDWDVLVTQLVRFPGTIAPVEHSNLYVCDPISNQFDLVAQWPQTGQIPAGPAALGGIREHLAEKPAIFQEFSQCGPDGLPGAALEDSQTFCMPIRFGQSLLGTLAFKLKDGAVLTGEQQDIFKGIGDELGYALKVGQDRKTLLAMNTSEITLAERRRVSHFLHDHLGHNLGFLHFKLDQLATSKDHLQLDELQQELEHLSKAARDSYEIVRGTLETMQPETMPMLINLLKEHARKVSTRSNIEIEFQSTGRQITLPVELKRVIFYVFEEALSNAEKHARAGKITVFTEWTQDYVALVISDDGVGFDPDNVNTDEHFGLGILRERLDMVGGQVTLTTAEKMGTTISVRIPLTVVQQQGVGV